VAIINAKIDDKLVKEFRHVIYSRHGLKKGDFKNALEEAMLDYIRKYAAEISIAREQERPNVIAEKANELEA